MLPITYGETAKRHKFSNDIVRIADDVISKIYSSDSHLFFENRIIFPGREELFRILSQLNVHENDSYAKDLLIRNIYKCEQTCAGAGYVLLCLLANKQVNFLNCGFLDRETISELINSSNLEILRDPLIKAYENCGPNCSVLINKDTKNSYVYLKKSLEFQISQIKEFGEEIELSNCVFYSYDGVVERVSQIDKIANDCINSNSTAIILARGFGYEVVSTLLHNYRSGRLKIIPVSSKSDWTSEFVTKDIAICLDIDCNSLKEGKVVERVKISNSFITFFDAKMSENAEGLFKKVSSETKNLNIDREIFKERLKSLSCKKIEIGIGYEYGNCKDVVADRIDYINRIIIRSKQIGYSNLLLNKKNFILPIDALNISKKVFESMEKIMTITKLVRSVE